MTDIKSNAITTSHSKGLLLESEGGFGRLEILVFKTSLCSVKHIEKVKPALNRNPCIKEWNVDLQDRDNILRIVAENIKAKEIEQVILDAGYACQELF